MASDSYKIAGSVERILDVRQSGQKSFQTVVIKTPGQYPQLVPVEFGEKCLGFIEKLREGDEVECDFSIRGREWNGKYFASLAGFKIFAAEQPHQRGSSVDNRRSQPAQEDTRRHYPLENRKPNGARQPDPDDGDFSF